MPKLYPAPLSDQDIADVSAFVETLTQLVESPSNDGAGLLKSREAARQSWNGAHKLRMRKSAALRDSRAAKQPLRGNRVGRAASLSRCLT